MLSERKAAILRAVVEGYISTSSPVGSGHVANSAALAVSAATVRNEMMALEEAGYLQQPHTSAGRIPTDQGYRYFVDTLMRPYQLDHSEAREVSAFFAQAQGELEQMLRSTSSFLAQLTEYAAVVVGPEPTTGAVRSVQLVSLSDRLLLAVVVLATGVVEKVSVELDHSMAEAQVQAAGDQLGRHVVGHTLAEAIELPSTGDPAVDAVCRRVVAELTATTTDPGEVYVGGTGQLAGLFDAVETVREVLVVLEKQYVVVSLINDVVQRGLGVAIGTETGVQPLAECSLVVAPYLVEGRPVGSIGVLGPTRMNYPQAVATVAVVSNQLSQRLTEG